MGNRTETKARTAQHKWKSLILPTVMLFIAGAAYGGITSANKLAMSAEFPFVAYTFWVALISGFVAGAMAILKRDIPKLTLAHIRQYTFLAVASLILPVMVLASVADKIQASILTLILALVPGLTYALAFLFKIEKFRMLSSMGIMLGAIGVLVVIIPEGNLPAPKSWMYVMIALVAALAAAASNVGAKLLRPPESGSLSLVSGILLTAALGLLPVMFLTDGMVSINDYGTTAIWGILWAAGIHVVTFYCFLEVIRQVGAVFFAQFNYIVTISGVIWAMIVFGESVSLWTWGALVIMLGSVALVNIGVSRTPN